jgi:hypothetical protein
MPPRGEAGDCADAASSMPCEEAERVIGTSINHAAYSESLTGAFVFVQESRKTATGKQQKYFVRGGQAAIAR